MPDVPGKSGGNPLMRLLRLAPPVMDVAIAAFGLKQVAANRATADADDQRLRHVSDRLGVLEQRLDRLEASGEAAAREIDATAQRLSRLVVVVAAIAIGEAVLLVLAIVALLGR